MKLIILAFVISISIHLLLFSYLKENKINHKQVHKSKVIKKTSSVRYVKLQPKIIKKPKIFKSVENKKVQKIKKIPKHKIVKKNKRYIPKISKRDLKLKKVTKIKPQEKRKTIKNKSLENFLLSEPVPLDKSMLDKMTRSYINVYGKEYDKFTKVQKVFIQNHIKDIVHITRQHFTFPDIALRKRLNDYNVVEFVLYPNGDISDLKMIKNGNYSFYDKAIMEAIEYAYKDYPRPKTATKIRFYLSYHIY